MEEWIKVETDEDIRALLEGFSGFHDSCIVSANYKSGNGVDEDGGMGFASREDYQLDIVFQSQMDDPIVLRFNGVRRMHLVGMQDNYFSDIFGASIKFYDNLFSKYGTERVVVWSDSTCFDIRNIDEPLKEPGITYIIANQLKWKKMTDLT